MPFVPLTASLNRAPSRKFISRARSFSHSAPSMCSSSPDASATTTRLRDSSASPPSCAASTCASWPSGCSSQRSRTSDGSASIGGTNSVGSRPVASERRHDSTIVGRNPAVASGGSSAPSTPSASRRSQLLRSCRARTSGSVSAPRASHGDGIALRAYPSRTGPISGESRGGVRRPGRIGCGA